MSASLLTEADFRSTKPLLDEQYFSETYLEAREKFRCAATALGEIWHVKQQSLMVKDPDYTMDVAIVKGTGSKGVLIHTSGVHGVEGYCGSAIQTSLLHRFVYSGERPATTIVFVHAVNPYGMAHYRRFNENNVDLNRNALTPEGWEEVLARDPNITGYEDFKDIFVAAEPPTRYFAYFEFWFRAAYLIARYGTRHMKAASVTATYQRENGIFFGGRELQPSHVILSKFLRDNFGHVPGEEVCWIDVHTGLGPKGADVLLCDAGDFKKVQAAYPGADVQCPDMDNADGSQAAGYELVRGVIKGGEGTFYQLPFKKSQGHALIVTQEFGTYAPFIIARAMILENRAFFHDFENHEYWCHFSRDAFYVRELEWKANILKRGTAVFEQTKELSKL
jgi:hypothetical protein